MEFPVQLRQKISDFLLSLPNIQSENFQQAIILNAGLDASLQQQVRYAAPAVFIPHLLDMLVKFGTLDDGRNALIAVLEAAKGYVGKDRQTECETLIDAVRQGGNALLTETRAVREIAAQHDASRTQTNIAGNVNGAVLSGNLHGTINIGK